MAAGSTRRAAARPIRYARGRVLCRRAAPLRRAPPLANAANAAQTVTADASAPPPAQRGSRLFTPGREALEDGSGFCRVADRYDPGEVARRAREAPAAAVRRALQVRARPLAHPALEFAQQLPRGARVGGSIGLLAVPEPSVVAEPGMRASRRRDRQLGDKCLGCPTLVSTSWQSQGPL